jgi:prophage tail gpP-like protein
MADDFDRDTFEVEIEGAERYRGIFKSYRLTSNYMTPTDAWEFVVFSEENQFDLRRIWRPLQPVRLYINGACQLVGRIDGIEGVPKSGGALRVFGRDYLADLVDATVDPQFSVQKGWTLEQAYQALFRPFGITKIESSNIDALAILLGSAASTKVKKTKRKAAVSLEDFKAEENLGVMELGSKIAARHGLILLPAPERDTIIVDSPNYDQDPIVRLERPGNILDASARRDYTSVPTVTIGRGRTGFTNDSASGGRSQYSTFTGPTAPSKRIAKLAEVQRILERLDGLSSVIEDRADLNSRAVPLAGTLYRPLFYRDKDSRNQEQLDFAVRRMIAERLRDTLTYDVTMQGHADRQTGAVYAVDTMADVADNVEDISERLWCFERTFVNEGDGPKTELKYIRPDSYVLEEPPAVAVAVAAGKSPAKKEADDKVARARAAEKFVSENFGIQQGPEDIIAGFR